MAKNEIDALNPVYREIAEKLDLKTAAAIYQIFKGQQLSFPMRFYSSKHIRRLIMQEYDGSNIKMLAVLYGYSEKSIRRIINGAKEKADHPESNDIP